MTAGELRRAAGEGAELLRYEAEHDMALPEIAADRTAFLEGALGLGVRRPG